MPDFVLPKYAAEFIRIANRTLAGQPTPEQLHQFRILGKRFRYTLEFFQPCYDEKLDLHLQTLREMQQDLGELNYLATIRDVFAHHDLGCQSQENAGALDAQLSGDAASLTSQVARNFPGNNLRAVPDRAVPDGVTFRNVRLHLTTAGTPGAA